MTDVTTVTAMVIVIVTVTVIATETVIETETTWAADAIRSVKTKVLSTGIGGEAPRRATAGPRATTRTEAVGTNLKPTGGMTAVMIDVATSAADPQITTLKEVASLTSVRVLTMTVAMVADTRSPRMALVMTLRGASVLGQSKVSTVALVEVAAEEEAVETFGVAEVEVEIEEVALWAAAVVVVVGPNPSRTHTRSR